MTIGQNIKRLRIQIDLTQAELGKLTKIPEFLIRYYELIVNDINIFYLLFRYPLVK